MSFHTRLLATQNPVTQQPESAGEVIPELSLFNRYNSQRYPYLLLSSAAREQNTQFDILICCPQSTLTLNSDNTLSMNIQHSGGEMETEDLQADTGFLDTLEKQFQDNKSQLLNNSTGLPFTGGWFVYLAYEMAAEIEPCLSLPSLPGEQPLAVAARCPAAIILDKKHGQLIALAEEKYSYLLDQLEQDYLTVIGHYEEVSGQQDESRTAADKITLDSLLEADEAPYIRQVGRVKQYIIDGDIFQANLSRLWQVTLKQDIDDAALFNALARQNPSSFAAMACLENITIISSSPERLVSSRNGIVETRPIAGTRPRDSNRHSDETLARELLEHPKEQAEHIMLIDLERNDLGRVCRPGTIKVDELMTLETWQHVHHIVSNVCGELQAGKSPVDILRAVFPGGTITGCPKVRCIEILAEMEQQARGAYTGSLGYINLDGSMDLNILIRTMIRYKTGTGRTITFRAGGGIVSDSIAENELQETRAKAKGLLKIFSL